MTSLLFVKYDCMENFSGQINFLKDGMETATLYQNYDEFCPHGDGIFTGPVNAHYWLILSFYIAQLKSVKLCTISTIQL